MVGRDSKRHSGGGSYGGGNDLMGLFDALPPPPPPPPPPPNSSSQTSESDPLLRTYSTDSKKDTIDFLKTVRTNNHKIDNNNYYTGSVADSFRSKKSFIPKRPSSDSGGDGFRKKVAVASSSSQQNQPIGAKQSRTSRIVHSLLDPFTSPSTWMGGIIFVLYHVVFCIAIGGPIRRPYSGESTLGDMARYTALGIIASSPYLVFALSNRGGRLGVPAMYPSVDIAVAPYLANAAAAIDKIIQDDWDAGIFDDFESTISRDEGDEAFLTKIWFSSFALVVSLGVFLAGFLLILASKNKLANLGSFLPYGVLCGFFSYIGIALWKMALSIDTPETDGDDDAHWTVILKHHIPSLVVGIAMNRLGPKHPLFVPGLLIFTVMTFYVVMLVTGTSLEEAKNDGWFYSEEELQSTASILYMPKDATVFDWNGVLPHQPFGTWVAVMTRCVYWKAVLVGAKPMIGMAIFYLLRASIHAAALRKNIHNMVRRVPIEIPEKTIKIPEKKNSSNITKINPGHRRTLSAASAFRTASTIAQNVRKEVRIVNLSLADGKNLKGRRFNSPCPPSQAYRKTSSGSTSTTMARNVAEKSNRLSIFRSISEGGCDDGSDADSSLLLPTTQREISGLTVTYLATPDTPLSKKKATTHERNDSTDIEVDYIEIHAPTTDLSLENIFCQYGYGMFLTAACGGFICCPTLATGNAMFAIGAEKPPPQYFSVILLLVAFYLSGFELVRFIPKAAFASLLVSSGADNIVTWFIKPIWKMDNLLEFSLVPLIAMVALTAGFLTSIILGIGMSTFLFVGEFFRVGSVKYDASGLEIRSRIERSLVQSVWLDTNGDSLRVLVLQNYLFFGNASSILQYIETMFEDIPLEESVRLDYPIPPIPVVLVLDLSLITGMDTSAVDIFMDILRICKTNDCKLYLCGLSSSLKKMFARGGMKPDTKGPRKFRNLLYFSDLDHGLGRAEEVLIDKKMGDFARQSAFRIDRSKSGFHIALQHIDQLHSTNMADGLLELESHTRIVTLEEGQILYEYNGGVIAEEDHGLFFIESGMIREEDGRSNRTNTRTGGSLRETILEEGNSNSLRAKHARLDTAAHRAALMRMTGKETTNPSSILRIATAGPGWVVGANEFAMGKNSLKKYKAISKVKMHHLRFSDLNKIEEKDPALVLRLYKMVTHVMARKEEDTVAHLSTLHDILNSPVNDTPVSRLSYSISRKSESEH